MLTKSILTATATAIALAAGLGTAMAAEKFTTLNVSPATPMTAAELDRVVGASDLALHVHDPGFGGVGDPVADVLVNNQANWDFGLVTAAGSGTQHGESAVSAH